VKFKEIWGESLCKVC